MDSTFSGSSLQGPPGPPKIVTENIINAATMDGFQRLEYLRDQWALVLQYADDDSTKYFKKRGDDSEFRYRLTGSTICTSPGGDYVDCALERFIPAVAYDAKSKTSVAVRRKIIEHAPSGEPIYPTMRMALFQFIEDFVPDGWATASEWEKIRAALKTVADRERAIKQAERSLLAEGAARRTRASLASENPEAALGQAIARGVAEALRELGVVGKKSRD